MFIILTIYAFRRVILLVTIVAFFNNNNQVYLVAIMLKYKNISGATYYSEMALVKGLFMYSNKYTILHHLFTQHVQLLLNVHLQFDIQHDQKKIYKNSSIAPNTQIHKSIKTMKIVVRKDIFVEESCLMLIGRLNPT